MRSEFNSDGGMGDKLPHSCAFSFCRMLAVDGKRVIRLFVA